MVVNILDALIIVLLIVGILGGFARGFFRETVLLIGLIACVVISWILRVPVSTFMYKNLPFFSFNGIFKGVSALNILLYEAIAFLIVFSLTYLILRILLKITGIIEKILKATIILGFFSKIAGGIVGFIEAYVIIFIILFICSQPFLNIQGMDDAKLPNYILDYTPFMSNSVGNIRKASNEIYELSKEYKNSDKTKFNQEALDLFIKYDIISSENVELLKEKGKI